MNSGYCKTDKDFNSVQLPNSSERATKSLTLSCHIYKTPSNKQCHDTGKAQVRILQLLHYCTSACQLWHLSMLIQGTCSFPLFVPEFESRSSEELLVLTGLPPFELEAEWDESCPEQGLWKFPSCPVGVMLRLLLLLLLPFLTSSSEVKSELSEGLRSAVLDEGN